MKTGISLLILITVAPIVLSSQERQIEMEFARNRDKIRKAGVREMTIREM